MRILRALVAILCFAAAGGAGATIVSSKHNLSSSGPGAVRAVSESRICVFCHTPHGASPEGPLWNRRQSGVVYTPYSSSTVVGLPGQPTGASLLCLSCHDGTVALGKVLSKQLPILMLGGVGNLPAGPARLGTDLSDDHPISFRYTPGLVARRGELAQPDTLTGAVRLDHNGELQCTSCHDPHEEGFGKFLVASRAGSALCTSCHRKAHWTETVHSRSRARWNGLSPDPWPTAPFDSVAENGCENCHRPHGAGGRQWLLRAAAEEDNCLACHNGNVARGDVAAQFTRLSRHPIFDTTGIHQAGEPAVVNDRHVECVDCHDPHAAGSDSGALAGPLANAGGVNLAGSPVDPASFDYEICFRCHADSAGKPPPRTDRQLPQTNVRLEFNTANPSFHPVAGPGRNPNVPSLLAPLTPTSTISCTDCHGGDDSPAAGGIGPSGVHGSQYAPMLLRQYLTQDFTTESPFSYALCYGCHDRNSILNNESFRHRPHVEKRSVPCNACHDPHGVSATQGNSVNNAHLINFDTSIVSPNSAGIRAYESTGPGRGRCFVSCHGVNHNPFSYGPPP